MKNPGFVFIIACLLTVIVCFNPAILLSQSTQTAFGQNRVQYKNFEWSFYETGNFRIYFYLGGQHIGRYVIEAAEKNLKKVEKILEYRIDHHIDILVYNNFSDLRQSNLGIGVEFYNTGGVAKVLGNKIFLYFDGNHANLDKQLREGISRLFINDMMYGGNIQEAVQNSVLLSLPDWFVNGLVSYVGEEWNTDLDNRLKAGILSGDYKKFAKITGVDGKFAGHSMWYYIATTHGKAAVPNLLYLTRINRSLESGFLFVLGNTLKGSIKDWYNFFFDRYTKDIKDKELPDDTYIIPDKTKKNRVYYQLKLSSNDKHIAYVTNQIGRFHVRLYNKVTGKSKVILRGGYKSLKHKTDYSYPRLAWVPNGDKLTILYEKKDNTYFTHYDISEGKKQKEKIEKFQKILDFAYVNNANTLVLSAINRGQSDIYTFYVPTHLVKRVTKDYYDDFFPQYIDTEDKQGILFISNRPHDTLKTIEFDTLLPMEHFNLFFYDYDKKSTLLLKSTNTPDIKERMPLQYDEKHFTFLSDANGIQNRYAAYFDTTFSHYDTLVYYKDSVVINPRLDSTVYLNIPNDSIDSISTVEVYKDTVIYFPITNYSSNILEHDISRSLQKSIDLVFNNEKYYFYEKGLTQGLDQSYKVQLSNTIYRNTTILTKMLSENTQKKGTKKDTKSQKTDLLDTTKIDIQNYYFQSEIKSYRKEEEIIQEELFITQKTKSVNQQNSIFKTGKVLPYRETFSTDYVVTQLDNSIIFTPYDNIAGGGAIFQTPNLDPLITLGASDLLEDYKFVGGFRIPTNISGNEYFITFENLKRRLDKKILFYRKSDLRAYDFTESSWYNIVDAKAKTYYVEGSLKWPFSETTSLRLYGAYRGDKITFLSTDTFSLGLPLYKEDWASLRTEYVFDNTIKWGMNLLEGTRFKLFIEGHKQVVELQKTPLPDYIKFPEPYFIVMGVDIRHYQKIHRQFIWANRFAITTSVGPKKVLYYLGGVDNWIVPKFDTETPIPVNGDFAFQALATNMRGFQQNIRNGNTYAIFNSELRFPIFRYFNFVLSSEFLKNFQIVAFADVGTAWTGFSPFDGENAFSTEIIEQGPIKIKFDYFTNPVVQGYGTGIRSTLLGYFIRVDVAWGLEDSHFTKPIYYFSLSLDF